MLHEGDVPLSEVVLLLLYSFDRVDQGLREPCLAVDAALLSAHLEIISRGEGRNLAHAVVVLAEEQASRGERRTPRVL